MHKINFNKFRVTLFFVSIFNLKKFYTQICIKFLTLHKKPLEQN